MAAACLEVAMSDAVKTNAPDSPLRALVRTWWLVPLTLVACVVTSYLVTRREIPTYRASTSVIVVTNGLVVESVRDTIDGLANLDRRNVVATLARITHSTDVLREAATRAGLDETTRRPFEVRAIVAPNTNIIEMEVIGPDPEVARRFAAEIATVSTSATSELYRIYRMKLLDEAESSSKPIRPDMRRNLVVAGVLGLIGGLMLAAAVDWIRRTLAPSKSRA
jgi:capsular polysaccharide biosynthesis protein